MSMLKGVSLSIFLAGCMALYIAVLMLISPIIPGATSMVDARVAYSFTILLFALFCCVVAGLTWAQASRVSATTAVACAMAAWLVLLVVVFIHLNVAEQLPL